MNLCKLTIILTSISLGACAAAVPPKFISSGHNPIIDREGATTNLLVDVCVRYDALGDSEDRFLGADSRTIASEVAANSAAYLSQNGIQLKNTLAPFVCGAVHNGVNEPQRYSYRPEDPISSSAQPLDLSAEASGDASYASALRDISTYIFNKALESGTVKAINIFAGDTPYSVSQSEFSAAARIVANRLGQPTLLYIGITGIRQSQGKSVLQAAAATALSAGLAAASATAIQQSSGTMMTQSGQLFKPPVVVLYPVYRPSTGIAISQIVAGLVDLRSGDLVWTNSLSGTDTSHPDSLGLLLLNIAHKPSEAWSPPGDPQSVQRDNSNPSTVP